MENGFSPGPNPFETFEERVKRIPLPNQLPPGLDFTGMPASVLRSSTLESLISQNEDLMARLSVSLRKINELEGAVGRAERDTGQLRARFETLKEQYLVLREKDRLNHTRGADLQRENVAGRERGEKLERQLAAVYVQGQSFQRRLQHLETYRVRVRRASRSLRARAREADQLKEDLRHAHEEITRLTRNFEARLNESREFVEQVGGKAREHDRLLEANVSLENQLVAEHRRFAVHRADAQAIIDELTTATADLRRELKDVVVKFEAQSRDLAELQTRVPELRTRRDELVEQVESLQALWSAKQTELERSEEKNANLQKLNQSLSVTLNEQRREADELRRVHEQERYAVENRFKTLRDEIKLLRTRLQTKD